MRHLRIEETWKKFRGEARSQSVLAFCHLIASLPVSPSHPDIPPRAVMVGGAVRDLAWGHAFTDVDMEVYGVQAEALEKLITAEYSDQVVAVGKAFGILKICFDGHVIDVALPRRESKTGSGHKGFTMTSDPWMTPSEAARRRDFTINAISFDPLTGNVVDPFHGLNDAGRRVLRIVDSVTFKDDPLRVYRAVQFTARFHLNVESSTREMMREMVAAGSLDELSRERITEEWRKFFTQAEQPSLGLELARALGIIERYYPELQALIGTPQEPEWHPEGDVWTHTCIVVDEAAQIARQQQRGFVDADRLHVVIGGLCHDLGKPAVTAVLDGRIRSIGHEEAGEDPARRLMQRWTFGEDVTHAAVVSAREHLKPVILFRSKQKGEMTLAQYRNAVRKLLRRIAPLSWEVFLAVTEADYRGRGLPSVHEGVYPYGPDFIQAIRQLEEANELEPLLLGRDLLDIGITPGPEMGVVLKLVEAARDRGEIRTKEEAMEWIRKELGR